MTARSRVRRLRRLSTSTAPTAAASNHVSGTRAGIVGTYQRHRYEEEMRAAVALWETHLLAILNKD
jgi:hypothetical protein